MAYEKHSITVGDTLTPLACQLKRRNASGLLEVVNLAGLVVKFSMVDSSGSAVVTESIAGVTVVDTDNGKVQYDFQVDDVDTAGTYFGWFTVYSGTEKDTYPSGGRKLEIDIAAAD